MEYKGPNEDYPFTVDLTNDLAGSTITGTPTVTAESGISANLDSNTTTTLVIGVTGGTIGNTYRIHVQASSAAGDVIEKEFYIRVRKPIVG